jgi:hypothetical protein
VVIATIVINVIGVSLLTFASWSDWRSGAALNFVDNCLLVGFAVVRRNALLARLRWRSIDFCLLPSRVSDYRSADWLGK